MVRFAVFLFVSRQFGERVIAFAAGSCAGGQELVTHRLHFDGGHAYTLFVAVGHGFGEPIDAAQPVVHQTLPHLF